MTKWGLFGLAFVMASCVTAKKYKALDKMNMDCETANTQLSAQISLMQMDTARLNAEILDLKKEKSSIEQSSTTEKESLSKQLSDKQTQLNSKQQLLDEKEKLLHEKESLLSDQEQKLKDLQNKLDKQAETVQKLRNTVANALLGFKGEDLSVEMRNGKVYVSLSENLLFKSGSAAVDPKGREAINKLAQVLEKNQDIDILVEGHTDNVPLIPGKFDDNWDLSASRALSIVRILTQDNKVEPKRVTAAGRGSFLPVASNDTPEGRARNRRTEIILSPKLDELYQLLEGK
jgi:chemotaxis protein MotB